MSRHLPPRALIATFVVAVAAVLAVALLGGFVTPDATTNAGAEPTSSTVGPTTSTTEAAPAVDAERVLADAQRQEADRLAAYAAAVEQAQADQAAAQAEAQRQADEAAALKALAAASAPASTNQSSSGIPDSYWDRMAQCETGGNWGMVGSRYSGGLGFYNGTWDSFGGREFASRAGYATRAQQITVANRVASSVGISGWGCVKVIGRP